MTFREDVFMMSMYAEQGGILRSVNEPVPARVWVGIDELEAELAALRKRADAAEAVVMKLRSGFQWLADLAEDKCGITIDVDDVDGEITIGHGLQWLHKHIDLADLCVGAVEHRAAAKQKGGE